MKTMLGLSFCPLMGFFVGAWETPGVAGFTFSVDFAGGLEVWQAFKKIRSRQRKNGFVHYIRGLARDS